MSRTAGQTTQQLIAKQLGISPVTVSYALRGGGTVSEKTRQRVMEAARALRYRPNSFARAIATGKAAAVALVLSTFHRHSVVRSQLIDGIEEALAREDIHLTLARLPDEQLTDAAQLPKVLREVMASGLLVNYTHPIPEDAMQAIRGHEVPSVWLNNKLPGDCVHIDDLGGSAAITRRLLALGHQRIVMAYQERSPHYSFTDRIAGYEQAMREAGLSPRVECLKAATPDEQTRRIMALLQEKARPTALMTYGPEDVYPILFAAARLGLECPRDLSVVTFGDHWASIGPLSFAMGILPLRELGGRAVRMLMRKLANPKETIEAERVAIELYEERTMGPAPVESR